MMCTFVVVRDSALGEIRLECQLVECRLCVPTLLGIERREDDVTQLLAQQLERHGTQRTLLEHYFARACLKQHGLELSAGFVILNIA